MKYHSGLSASSLLAAAGLMSGCLDTATEPAGGKRAAGQGRENAEAPAPTAFRTAWVSDFFSRHEEVQSDGGTGVEKFVDCPYLNQMLVGWGGRVDGDGNFTDIKIGCVYFWPSGLASGTPVRYPKETTPAEKYVEADPGNVVVGVGGVVDNENLTRAVIRQCPWDPVAMAVIPGSCTFKSSDGSTSMETYMDIHDRVEVAKRPLTVLTGVGATAGFQALKVVRVTKGTLKVVPVNLKDLSGGEQRFSFQVPQGGQNVRIEIYSGTGNADLYVGNGYVPTTSGYSCRPYAENNSEACYFQNAGTYHVLIHPRTPYTGVSLHADYTMP